MDEKNAFYKSTEFWVVFFEVIAIGIINIVSFKQLPNEQAWVVLVLSLTILILKNTLYFTIKQILDNEKTLLDDIYKDIKFEEITKSYNSIQPELKPYADELLHNFKRDIEEVFVRDKRTGKLEKRKYYDELHKSLESVIGNGNIWACSSLFDNEWDPTDNFEKKWMQAFIDADKKNVLTKRIFIFNNDKLLRPEGDVPDSNISDMEFLEKYKDYVTLKNLIPYLINASTTHLYHYPNTKSFAIDRKEWEKYKEFLGYGFCAFEFNNNSKKDIFIRDTSPDRVGEQELCGEILFDEEKIKLIKIKFTELINSRNIDSLKEYVINNSNAKAKEFLTRYGVVLN